MTVQTALKRRLGSTFCNYATAVVVRDSQPHNRRLCCDQAFLQALQTFLEDGNNRASCRAIGYEFQYNAFDYFIARQEAWNLRMVVTVRNPTTHVLSMLTHELYFAHKHRRQHEHEHPPTLRDKLLSASKTFNRNNMLASVLSGNDQNATEPVIDLTRALQVVDSAYLVLVTEYLDSGIAAFVFDGRGWPAVVCGPDRREAQEGRLQCIRLGQQGGRARAGGRNR
jgi:hypothetical protein